MRKHIKAAALIMALALLLTGCNNNKNNSQNNTFDRSGVFDENGYWKGIKASEYVTLPDLTLIKVEQASIDEEIESFLNAYPTTKQVKDRAVKDGDTINIDFVGKIDGKEFEGGSTQGQGTNVTIGNDTFIDNMLERMIGHMPGETFDMDARFPDDPKNPDLAGKDSVFTVTINYISESVISTWSNEFVAGKLSEEYGWNNTAEAEQGIKAALAEDILYDTATFLKDVPQSMNDYQVSSMIAYYESLAEAYGMDLATLVTGYMGYETVDDLKESYRTNAEKTSKFYLIYQAIAESRNFKLTEDDLKAYFLEMTGSADYTTYKEAFGVPYIKAMVMYEKMSGIIADSAQIVH